MLITANTLSFIGQMCEDLDMAEIDIQTGGYIDPTGKRIVEAVVLRFNHYQSDLPGHAGRVCRVGYERFVVDNGDETHTIWQYLDDDGIWVERADMDGTADEILYVCGE